MKTSKAHQRFADYLNNQRVLEHPEEFLGPNWKDVLNFWLFLDTLSEEQWEIFNKHYQELSLDAWAAAFYSARDAAWAAAWIYADVARNAARNAAAGNATLELIGSHILKEQEKPLTFLSLFDYQPPFNN